MTVSDGKRFRKLNVTPSASLAHELGVDMAKAQRWSSQARSGPGPACGPVTVGTGDGDEGKIRWETSHAGPDVLRRLDVSLEAIGNGFNMVARVGH